MIPFELELAVRLTNVLLIPGIAWSSQDPSVFASLSYDGRVCEFNFNHDVILFYFYYFLHQYSFCNDY